MQAATTTTSTQFDLFLFRKYNLDVYIAMTHAPGMLAYKLRRKNNGSTQQSIVWFSAALWFLWFPSKSKWRNYRYWIGKRISRKLREFCEIWEELVLDGKPVQ